MKNKIKSILLIFIGLVIGFFAILFFRNCNHNIFVMNKSKNSIYYDFRLPSEKDKYSEYGYLELKPNETIVLERFGFYGYNKFSLYIKDPKTEKYKTIEFELKPNDRFDYQHQIIIEDSLKYKIGKFGLEYNNLRDND